MHGHAARRASSARTSTSHARGRARPDGRPAGAGGVRARGRCAPARRWPSARGTAHGPRSPTPERTCFERDRDRIVHSTAFRRLAGKTQVVVHPTDHQRTRLTHALEVAQVATSIARGIGVNVALADAIALGHDCGHGPGGHASEDAFDAYVPGGFDHGPWGADVSLTDLNLCAQTLDGIRNHSWSRPAPATVEGEIVSWADRIAYCAHDLEDAVHAGIVRDRRDPRRGRRRRRTHAARAARALRPGRRDRRRRARRGRDGRGLGGGAGRRCGRSTTSGSTSGPSRSPSPARWWRCCRRWSSTSPRTRRRCPSTVGRDRRPGADRRHLRRRDDRPLRLRHRGARARLGPRPAAPGGRRHDRLIRRQERRHDVLRRSEAGPTAAGVPVGVVATGRLPSDGAVKVPVGVRPRRLMWAA